MTDTRRKKNQVLSVRKLTTCSHLEPDNLGYYRGYQIGTELLCLDCYRKRRKEKLLRFLIALKEKLLKHLDEQIANEKQITSARKIITPRQQEKSDTLCSCCQKLIHTPQDDDNKQVIH